MSIFKNNFVVGVTAGIVASMLAPVLAPALKRSSRPLAKTLVKGGLRLYEHGREAVAGAGEMMEDVMAEIHAEQAAKQAATVTAAAVAGDAATAPQPHVENDGIPAASGNSHSQAASVETA